MVELFRFPVVESKKFAEAECARLSAVGLVDAVMSDDGDSFLFGARKVIRNWSGDGRAKGLADGGNGSGGLEDGMKTPKKGTGGKRKRNAMEELEAQFWGSEDFESDDLDETTPSSVASSSRRRGKKSSSLNSPASKRQKIVGGGIGARMGKDYIEVYTADEIHDMFGLDRNGLILTGLIGGSDCKLLYLHLPILFFVFFILFYVVCMYVLTCSPCKFLWNNEKNSRCLRSPPHWYPFSLPSISWWFRYRTDRSRINKQPHPTLRNQTIHHARASDKLHGVPQPSVHQGKSTPRLA
jgi:hypothetical protein